MKVKQLAGVGGLETKPLKLRTTHTQTRTQRDFHLAITSLSEMCGGRIEGKDLKFRSMVCEKKWKS